MGNVVYQRPKPTSNKVKRAIGRVLCALGFHLWLALSRSFYTDLECVRCGARNSDWVW